MTLTIKEVKKRFSDKGHTLVSSEYENATKLLDYNCKCGNPEVCHISINHLTRGVDNCKICIKEKSKKTSLSKYGVEHPMQSSEVQEKSKQTCLLKYGFKYATQSIEVKEKSKQTCLLKFGVDNAMRSEELKNKQRETMLELYGKEYSMQITESFEKMKKTMLERYEVEFPLKSEFFREKMKQTMLQKYGAKHSMHVFESFKKMQKSSFSYKDFQFPDSLEIIKIQGYEHLCLKELLENENITEEDILAGYENMPIIWYKIENNNHRYYPDIYIPSKNLIIEVKSTYTYNSAEEITKAKMKACNEKGYNAEIRIYTDKLVINNIITFYLDIISDKKITHDKLNINLLKSNYIYSDNINELSNSIESINLNEIIIPVENKLLSSSVNAINYKKYLLKRNLNPYNNP